MSAYEDTCPECGRKFTNYHDLRANRQWCSVGCQADAALAKAAIGGDVRLPEGRLIRATPIKKTT